MIYEYIALIYNEFKERTERKYGIVVGDTLEAALANLGKWYGDTMICVEYFGTPCEDEGDAVYELNDEYADRPDITGRKFGKIIPSVVNKIEYRAEIYE